MATTNPLRRRIAALLAAALFVATAAVLVFRFGSSATGSLAVALPHAMPIRKPRPPVVWTSSDAAARTRVLELLSAGNQADAEELMASQAQKNHSPENDFDNATLIRSRFDKAAADVIFRSIAADSPDTVLGQASQCIVNIDTGVWQRENLERLDQLSSAHPDDPMLLWAVCIECRETHRNKIGIERYTTLVKTFNPGPSLVHQTLGNLYLDSGDPADALVHYDLSIKVEPAFWNYDSRGLALAQLKRYDEAGASFEKAHELEPSDMRSLTHWHIMAFGLGDQKLMAAIEAKMHGGQ